MGVEGLRQTTTRTTRRSWVLGTRAKTFGNLLALRGGQEDDEMMMFDAAEGFDDGVQEEVSEQQDTPAFSFFLKSRKFEATALVALSAHCFPLCAPSPIKID